MQRVSMADVLLEVVDAILQMIFELVICLGLHKKM